MVGLLKGLDGIKMTVDAYVVFSLKTWLKKRKKESPSREQSYLMQDYSLSRAVY